MVHLFGKTGKPSRRDVLTGTAAGAAAWTLGMGAPAVLAQSTKPLRLGVLNTFTGVLAQSTESNMRGMNLYFDSINWSVAGRKIELIKEDDQFNPQVGLQKARKLVENDQVDLLLGPQGSGVTLAVFNYAKQSNTIMLTWAGADALTWERPRYLFRPTITTWQLSTPMGKWVHENVAKEVVLFASDYVAGHDVLRTFRLAFERVGGKVVKEIYPPVGTADFSPYLTEARSLQAPGAYAFFVGADSIRFVQQYAQVGLKAKTPLTGFTSLTDGTTLPSQGKAALDIITAQTYVDTLDNPTNRKFVADYRAAYSTWPDLYSDYGWVTARIVADAVRATDGDTANKDKLAEAIGKVAFEAPRGPFRFDPVTHTAIITVYVVKVVEIDGRFTHSVMVTMNDIVDPGSKQD